MPTWDPGLPPWADALLWLAVIASPILTLLLNRRTARAVTETQAEVVQASTHAKAAAESAGVAAAETTRNHGSSLKDAVDRIERDLRSVTEEQARQGAAQNRIEHEIAGVRRGQDRLEEQIAREAEDRRDVSRRLDEHIRAATDA